MRITLFGLSVLLTQGLAFGGAITTEQAELSVRVLLQVVTTIFLGTLDDLKEIREVLVLLPFSFFLIK